MDITCISDLHGHYPKLEGGNLLIVAGDLTARDTDAQHAMYIKWQWELPYKKIIFIAGNHDNFIERHPDLYINGCNISGKIAYLQDSGTEFTYYPPMESGKEGEILERKTYKIWGSPWTKTFEGMNPKCKAFTCDTEEELAEKWALIPQDVDILITHSPPYGILDEVEIYGHERDECNEAGLDTKIHVGSKSLALKIGNMEKPPLLWCWGHIHEAYGEDLAVRSKSCKMINCSHVNEYYEPVNKPILVIL